MKLENPPNRPECLKSYDDGNELLIGDDAHFFFEPQTKSERVDIILDYAVSDKDFDTYEDFIKETQASNQWPSGVIYIGGQVNGDQTIISFRATNVEDIKANLPHLLEPFQRYKAEDLTKLLKSFCIGNRNTPNQKETHILAIIGSNQQVCVQHAYNGKVGDCNFGEDGVSGFLKHVFVILKTLIFRALKLARNQ
ncbi:MAG: hypothetical protein ACYTF1_14275 [Planctomycetota bacterium]|jgi:hypothetical protein